MHTGGLSENCLFARHADPGADLHQGELAIPLASTKSDSVPCAACRHVKKSRLRASRLDGVSLPACVWWSLLALGLLCTSLGYVLYFRLIADVGALKALTVTFVIPLFGLL